MNANHPTWASVNLDAIRGLAALVVVAGHARGLFFGSVIEPRAAPGPIQHLTQINPEHLTIGHEAVMVFFVLSGYLVGGSVLRQIAANRWSWNDYILKRLVRLWVVLIPVMFIGLGLDVVGHTFFAGSGSLYGIPPGQDYVQANTFSARMTFSTLIGNILFLQTILVPTAGTNIPLWSLAYEFWYYMAFPLVAIACDGRSSKKKSLVYLLAALGILLFIGSHAGLFVFHMVSWRNSGNAAEIYFGKLSND